MKEPSSTPRPHPYRLWTRVGSIVLVLGIAAWPLLAIMTAYPYPWFPFALALVCAVVCGIAERTDPEREWARQARERELYEDEARAALVERVQRDVTEHSLNHPPTGPAGPSLPPRTEN